MSSSAWAIQVGVELDASAKQIAQQLQKYNTTIKVGVDTGDSAGKVNDLSTAGENLGLTFQEANLIMSRSIEAISSMIEQVYELDGALTEFKKVSDLSGSSLESYTADLTKMGKQVARTGKPLCRARMYGW